MLARTIKRLIWIGALAALAVWSLLSWGSYWLVTAGADWLAAAGGVFALPPEWQYGLEWSLRLVEQFGVVLLWIVWGVVAVVILVGAWIASVLAGMSGRLAGATPAAAGTGPGASAPDSLSQRVQAALAEHRRGGGSQG